MSSQEGGRKIRDEWACLRGERPSRGARSALERGRGVSEREGRRTLTKPPTLSQAPAHTESTNACATRRDTDTLVTDAGGQCGSPGRPRACPAPHEWRGPASVHLRPLHARDSSWKTGQLGSATGGSGVHLTPAGMVGHGNKRLIAGFGEMREASYGDCARSRRAVLKWKQKWAVARSIWIYFSHLTLGYFLDF